MSMGVGFTVHECFISSARRSSGCGDDFLRFPNTWYHWYCPRHVVNLDCALI